LGRGLSGSVADKHNVKRIGRLIGNGLLHTEVPIGLGFAANRSTPGNRLDVLLLIGGTFIPACACCV